MSFAILTRTRHSVGVHGRYLAEICRAEGLMDHVILDLDTVDSGTLGAELRGFATLVVGPCSLFASEISELIDHLEGGGTLIAIRPSRQLARALGLRSRDEHLPGAYVRAVPNDPITSGLVTEPVQSLVAADLYGPVADARVLAQLWSTRSTPTTEPAVFSISRGLGTAVVFSYDIGHSIARLRHGDASLVGVRGQGGLPYRCTDLMLDQVDRLSWHQPQADVHALIFTNALIDFSTAPTPRWWYYPSPAMRTLVVQDCDDDWSTPDQFEAMIQAADRHGFRTTFYLMMGNRPTALTADRVAELEAAGHSFGIHHDGLENWEDGEDQNLVLAEVIRKDVETFRRQFGHPPITNRNHALVWIGTDALPRLYQELGITMEFNAQGPPDCWLNYLAGSSKPLRHVAGDGTVLDVFQQPTQVYDDSQLVGRLGGDPATEAEAVRQHLEGLLVRGHGPLSMQSHPVSFATYSQKFFELVWSHANDLGIEIWSAENWARHVLARDQSAITQTARIDGWQLEAAPMSTQVLLLPMAKCAEVRLGDTLIEDTVIVHGLHYWSIPLGATAIGSLHELHVTIPS